MVTSYCSNRPFEKLYVDFLGPYPRSKSGNAYVFIVLDHFSKFVFSKALKQATSSNIIKFLRQEIFNVFGVPHIIHSDNGKQFLSQDFQNLLSKYCIKHFKTANYAPQSNASERVNRTLLSAIRSYLKTDQREWDIHLSDIACALRSSVHSATGVSPYFALFGTNMISHGSGYKLAQKLNAVDDNELLTIPRQNRLQCLRNHIRDNILKANEKSAKMYNTRTKKVKYLPGQEVYRRNFILSDSTKYLSAKLSPKYVKCRISKQVGNQMYELENLAGKKIGISHAKDLKQ